MTRNWNDIKWIFEPDGSLRDIYVQDITLLDWEKIIDFINLNFNLKYGENSHQIDKEYSMRYLMDETGEMESKALRINLNNINIHCYFFLQGQIEFDVDPKEINSLQDFESIEKFMMSVSKTLNNQVTLTGEDSPHFPYFKIDFDKKVNKVLTKKEAYKLSGNQHSISTQLTSLMTKLKMRLFPKTFVNQVIKSANETYKSTEKNKNVW